MIAALDRLDAVLDEETAALETTAQADLAEFARRKSRSLLDLTRLARATADAGADPVFRARLAATRTRLAVNQRLLGLNLAAAQEVASLLAQALRDAESDGTYSRHPQGRGAR